MGSGGGAADPVPGVEFDDEPEDVRWGTRAREVGAEVGEDEDEADVAIGTPCAIAATRMRIDAVRPYTGLTPPASRPVRNRCIRMNPLPCRVSSSLPASSRSEERRVGKECRN